MDLWSSRFLSSPSLQLKLPALGFIWFYGKDCRGAMPAAILVASSAGERRCQEFHQQAHRISDFALGRVHNLWPNICYATIMWPKMNPLGLGMPSRNQGWNWVLLRGEHRILDVFVIGSVKLPILPTTDGCNTWRARDSFWQGIIQLDSRSRLDDYLTTYGTKLAILRETSFQWHENEGLWPHCLAKWCNKMQHHVAQLWRHHISSI